MPGAMFGVVLLVSLVAATGCDNVLGLTEWTAVPDTVDLYSWYRSDLTGTPAAYDFVYHRRVVVEAETGNWDLVLGEQGEELVLLTLDALALGSSSAGIEAVSGISFDALAEASVPADSVYRASAVMEEGGVYIIRTREYVDAYGYDCVGYAKMEPLLVDRAAGRMTFQYIANPNCNDRSLVP